MDNGTATAAVDVDVEVLRFDPSTIRINPQAMRMLTAATGRTMEQLMASDEPADKFQAMAFFELRRRHPGPRPGRVVGAGRDRRHRTGGHRHRRPFRDRVCDNRAAFAHYWRLHPDTIDDLDPDMYAAMVRLMQREAAAIKAANAKAGRR